MPSHTMFVGVSALVAVFAVACEAPTTTFESDYQRPDRGEDEDTSSETRPSKTTLPTMDTSPATPAPSTSSAPAPAPPPPPPKQPPAPATCAAKLSFSSCTRCCDPTDVHDEYIANFADCNGDAACRSGTHAACDANPACAAADACMDAAACFDKI